jgi:tRNA (guanine-N(7)-)-methyltransferase subunit TRM82
MSLPYQSLTALGPDGIVCAARGSIIFTFAANGSLLSSWEHPATQRAPNPAVEVPENGAADSVGETETATPPPKRRRVDPESTENATAKETTEEQPEGDDAKANGKKKPVKKGRSKPDFSSQEKPYVNIMKATHSGSHLIAMTGMDKNVWVFEHDGKGQLKEVSQR